MRGLEEEGEDFEGGVVGTEVEMEAVEEALEVVEEMVDVVVTVALVVGLVEMVVVKGWEGLEVDEDAEVGLGVGLGTGEAWAGRAGLAVEIAGVEEELVVGVDLVEVCDKTNNGLNYFIAASQKFRMIIS